MRLVDDHEEVVRGSSRAACTARVPRLAAVEDAASSSRCRCSSPARASSRGRTRCAARAAAPRAACRALSKSATRSCELGLDLARSRARARRPRRHVVGGREDDRARRVAPSTSPVSGSNVRDALDLVAEELDADGGLFVGRLDLERVAADAERAALEARCRCACTACRRAAQERVVAVEALARA